jgi:ligand-binding sensor domain-containing protein
LQQDGSSRRATGVDRVRRRAREGIIDFPPPSLMRVDSTVPRRRWPRPRAAALGAWLGLVLLDASRAAALDPGKPLGEFSLSAWQTDEGLPQSTVQALVQTRDGYIWVATTEGLARFDGVRFTVFDRSNTEAFRASDVQALLETRDGSLWIAVYGGGLVRYRDGKFRSYGPREGLTASKVIALAEDEDGLWVASDGDGLYRSRGETFSAVAASQLGKDSIWALHVDRDRTVWLGTTAGLYRLDAKQDAVAAAGLAKETITALAEDRAGRLWVGTYGGLYGRVAQGGFVRYAEAEGLCQDSVRTLRLDTRGSLWIGTDRGLNRLWEGRLSCLLAKDGLTDDKIASIMEDREGSLWIGTLAGGLNQLKEGAVHNFSTLQGLPSDNVETVATAREGGFWIGTNLGEVGRIVGGRFVALPESRAMRGAIVRALHEDRRGRLWVGTDVGLHRFESGRWDRYGAEQGLSHNVVRALLEDQQGRLWIGTDGGGLYCLEGGRFSVLTTKDGLPSGQIRALLEGHDGTLWIATYGGLAALRGGRLQSYTVADGLASDLVRALHVDEDGMLWIGTYGGGLSHLEGGRLRSYSTRDGLHSDVIYAILEDDRGRLWMTCNGGVFAVSKRELADLASGKVARVSPVTFGRSDGMRSAEFNGGSPAGVEEPDGRIWFPTVKGLVTLLPSGAMGSWKAPPPLVENIEVDGVRLEQPDRLDLSPGQRRVAVHYTSLGLLAPQRMRFSYKLEGFDPDWIDAGTQRTAYYTALPAGDYRFRVRVRTETGVWEEAATALPVRQRAHWYRTRAFLLLAGAVALLVAAAAYRLRVRGLLAREAELSRRVDEALADVKVLGGLIPICSSCKKIRDDRGFWNQLEAYLRDHSEATLTHGICPECAQAIYPDAVRRLKARAKSDA